MNNWWDYTDGSSCLMHHGVKGMKWGRRKQPQYTSEDRDFIERWDSANKEMRRKSRIAGALLGSAYGGAAGAISLYRHPVLGGLGGAAAGGALGYGLGAASGGLSTAINSQGKRSTRNQYSRETGKRIRPMSSVERSVRDQRLRGLEGNTYGLVGTNNVSDYDYINNKRRRNSGGRTTNYNY